MTRRLDLAMLLVLTFSTGMVDAIGYLGFDKVFTGNMTLHQNPPLRPTSVKT